MSSLLVPSAYAIVLVTSMIIFSRIYRARVAASKRLEPWFPSHPERDLYVSLLQSDPPAHEGLVKAALLRRAVADIHRIMRIREDKPALAGLLQRGSIGDDLWNSFLAAEKELEAEVLEVVTEAETFKQGWGNLIFQTANECVQNEKLREAINKVYLQRPDLEVKYGVTKRLFPTVQVTNGPPPAAAQQITAKDAAMAAAVQKAVAMGATIPVPAPAGSPAPSQPDSAAPGTPTTSGGPKKAKKRK